MYIVNVYVVGGTVEGRTHCSQCTYDMLEKVCLCLHGEQNTQQCLCRSFSVDPGVQGCFGGTRASIRRGGPIHSASNFYDQSMSILPKSIPLVTPHLCRVTKASPDRSSSHGRASDWKTSSHTYIQSQVNMKYAPELWEEAGEPDPPQEWGESSPHKNDELTGLTKPPCSVHPKHKTWVSNRLMVIKKFCQLSGLLFLVRVSKLLPALPFDISTSANSPSAVLQEVRQERVSVATVTSPAFVSD